MKQERIFFKSMETKKKRFLGKATGLLLFLLLVLFGNVGYAQSSAANAGREFYFTYLHNRASGGFPTTLQLKVVVEQPCYITAEYNNAAGTYWNGWDGTVLIPAGIYTDTVRYANVFELPGTNNTGSITSKTIRLTSSENVCVYAINYYSASTDGTCILPVTAWGTEYRLATGIPITNTHSSLYAVVAKEAGTVVTLHDGTTTITLNQNQAYHFRSNANIDMTGMRVSATKPIALFSGGQSVLGPGQQYNGISGFGCSRIGNASSDHTYEQLWSVDKWGTDFFAFPVRTPNGGNPVGTGNWGGMLAIVAHENGTTVTVSGGINSGTPLVYSMNAGDKVYTCDSMSGLTRIVADKPIMPFLSLPDACIMTFQPTDQRISHAFVSPFILSGTTNVNAHGIDLLMPAAFWSQTVIKENGVVVANSTYTVNASSQFPDWYHIRKNLPNSDTHINIDCPSGFLAYISGSGSAETYAFSAGSGAFDLQCYFTVKEQATTNNTYYQNTTVFTHTFDVADTVVVNRMVTPAFTSISWRLNGVPYAFAENTSTTNMLKIPATALISGDNVLTMVVRFSGSSADSLYTGHIWRIAGVEVCAGDSIEFVADVTPVGLSAAYQWFVNDTAYAGATDTVFGYAPNDGDIVRSRIVSDACTDMDTLFSAAIIIQHKAIPQVSVSIRADTNDVCTGTSVTFTATPTNGGNTTYQWIINGRDTVGETGQTFTYQPEDGDLVQVRITSSLDCATPNPVESDPLTMKINPKGTPTIIIRRKTE